MHRSTSTIVVVVHQDSVPGCQLVINPHTISYIMCMYMMLRRILVIHGAMVVIVNSLIIIGTRRSELFAQAVL